MEDEEEEDVYEDGQQTLNIQPDTFSNKKNIMNNLPGDKFSVKEHPNSDMVYKKEYHQGLSVHKKQISNDDDYEEDGNEFLTVERNNINNANIKYDKNEKYENDQEANSVHNTGNTIIYNKGGSLHHNSSQKSKVKLSIKETQESQANKKTNQSNNNTQQNFNENFDKINSSKSLSKLISNTSSNIKLLICILLGLGGEGKSFNHFDVQALGYDLIKEYSHLKIDKDEEFLQRMLFDTFKRQTKEERLEKLIDKYKVKMDESDRVKAFNRLIIDANRRIEAQENMQVIKSKLEEGPPSLKKYSQEEWEEIYENR